MSRHRHHTRLAEAWVRKLHLGRLATVATDGEPHCVPVIYTRDTEIDRFLFMTPRSTLKARNVAATGRAALAIEDGQTLRGVSVRGRARILYDAEEERQAFELMRAAGRVDPSRRLGAQVIVELRPEAWSVWGLKG
jgi:F420H(2)-dependent biliverdin reductase